jgi:hypothetical protein
MFERMRRSADEHNARLLGYVDEINYRDTPTRVAGAGTAYDDLIDDIENERYYVLIMAYDFRTAREKGERKLLWATRVSVQAQGNRFDENVQNMLTQASRYFGQNSDRLIRQYQDKGKVNLGELKVIGIVPSSDKADEKGKK